MRNSSWGAILLMFVALSCADLPTTPGDRIVVTGSILDRDGGGIEGARVAFFAATGPGLPGGYSSATTDAAGSYQAELVEGRYSVYIDATGFIADRFPDIELSKARNRMDHRFTGVRISGVLTGPGGALLPNAEGIVYGDHGSGSIRVTSGTYSVLLPPGTYDLYFRSGDNTLGLPEIRLPQVSVASDTTIDVLLDGNLVTGVVLGPGGVPLVGATVAANSIRSTAHNRTLLNGGYSLRLPSGGYIFRVTPPSNLAFIASRGYGPFVINQPVTLDFDLSGVEWTGTVRRAIDATPVASASIFASEEGASSYASAISDATGSFRLIVRPGALYRIRAIADQGRLAAPEFGVIAGADSSFDIELKPAAQNFIYIDAPKKPPYAIPSGGARWAGMRGGMSIVSE
jgi:Carboxypeptidase regulatory-like domain